MKSFEEILQIFKDNNLVIRQKKTFCVFSRVDFFGHTVGCGSIKPISDNVQKILNIIIPKTKKHVKGVICLLNFHGKFIPNPATILLPLFELTQ